jgi:hypothetical protein
MILTLAPSLHFMAEGEPIQVAEGEFHPFLKMSSPELLYREGLKVSCVIGQTKFGTRF